MSEQRRIAQADPRLEYIAQREEIDAAVARVLASGRYILADEVAGFEAEFASYLGARHCVGAGSGTDAIQLALRALNIGAGAGVITAGHTAVATVAAIELAGARPILCDIDPATFTLDLQHVKQTLERVPNVAAIVPVHLYGHPADMTALTTVARERGLKVIEDCAQAIGAEWCGRKVGTWGDAAAFSFYPTKNLAAFGDAGALVTNDAAVAERARELRVYGWRQRYISERVGINTRLDEIQAAILRVKLPQLEARNERRRAIAARYRARLANADLRLPVEAPAARHVYHQFTISSPRRDTLKQALEANHIGSAVLYPLAIHQQPAYRDRRLAVAPLPNAETACRELLCLPMHPWLDDSDVERVADVVSRTMMTR